MSVSSKYVLHGLLSGANFISQIENARVSPDVEMLIDHPSGLDYPMNMANIRTFPIITFETTQLLTLLGLGGSNGVTLIDLSAGNVDLFFKATTNKASRVADATTSHQRYRAAAAALSVDRISASQGAPARAFCTLYCIYNGSTNPLVATGSVALSGTPTAADRWTLGPTTITDTVPAAVTIAGLQDWTLDYQRQVEPGYGDGDQFPTHLFQRSLSPVITCRGFDMLMPTLSSVGIELSDVTSYLRRSDTTGPKSNATTEHIKIVADSGVAIIDEVSGSGNDAGMTAIRIPCATTSASANPITITTGSAIT